MPITIYEKVQISKSKPKKFSFLCTNKLENQKKIMFFRILPSDQLDSELGKKNQNISCLCTFQLNQNLNTYSVQTQTRIGCLRKSPEVVQIPWRYDWAT